MEADIRHMKWWGWGHEDDDMFERIKHCLLYTSDAADE